LVVKKNVCHVFTISFGLGFGLVLGNSSVGLRHSLTALSNSAERYLLACSNNRLAGKRNYLCMSLLIRREGGGQTRASPVVVVPATLHGHIYIVKGVERPSAHPAKGKIGPRSEVQESRRRGGIMEEREEPRNFDKRVAKNHALMTKGGRQGPSRRRAD